MIIEKFSVFTKRQIVLFRIINFIQITGSIILIISAIIAAIPNLEENFNFSYYLALILGVCGIVSLVDVLIKGMSSSKTLAYKFVMKHFGKRRYFYDPRPSQAEICSWANKYIPFGESLLIYGEVNVGKTTSIFIYLCQCAKNNKHFLQLEWINNILYIDCKSDKGSILKFLKQRCHENEVQTLFIIDNIETMGSIFLDEVIKLIDTSCSTFILIMDASKLESQKIQSKSVSQDDYIYYSSKENFETMYNSLDRLEKEAFLVMYYISLSSTLIPIKDVFNILEKTHKPKRIIKSLVKKGFVLPFPFNYRYLIVRNRNDILSK